MLAALLRPGDTVVTVRPNSARAAAADVVAAAASGLGAITCACGDPQAALTEAENRAQRSHALLVAAGSLYLVGGIRALLMEGR